MATTGGNLLQRTRCVYFQDVTTPCNKREPGTRLLGDRRLHPLPRRSSGPPAVHGTMPARHAPLRHGGGAGRARRAGASCSAPTASAACPFAELHRLPGDDPHRDTVLEHGELITAVELPAAARGRQVGLPQGARPGVLRVRAGLGGRRAGGRRRHGRATSASRSAASPTSRGGPPGPRTRCAAHRPTRGGFRAAAEAELPTPRRSRSTAATASRSRWPATLVAVAARPDRRRRHAHDRAAGAPRAIGQRPSPAGDGPAKVTGTAPYAFEHGVENPAFCTRCRPTVARGPDHRDRHVRGRGPRRRARRAHPRSTRRGWRPPRTPSWRSLQDAEVPSAASSIGGGRRRDPRDRPARRGARSASSTTSDGIDAELRADRDDLYAPDKVNPGYPTDTAEGDVDAALAAAAVTVEQTLHHGRWSTTTRWSRTPRIGRCGTDGADADAVGLHPGRARRAEAHRRRSSASTPSRCG